jgi:hypothetical protein
MTGTTPPGRGCTSRRATALVALAAAALAALALPAAPAAASTVALVDRGANQNELGLVFRAGRGERNRVTITFDEFSVTITDLAGVRTSDPNCTRPSANTAVCQTPIEQVPPNLGRADISLGDGNDTLTLRNNLPGTCVPHLKPNPVVFVTGGPGNDRIRGSSLSEKLMGGPGNDIISGGPCDADVLEGGPGNDKLTGGPNDDILRGGPGNDRLFGGAGDDQLFGGPGRDKLVGGPGRDVTKQ